MASSSLISCRWDWCRSSFASIDALDKHVKHDHIWPMKPMRKADITLMRRMDLQSLHSSQDTESGIIPRGLISGKTPLVTPPTSTPPENEPEAFDTFTQLSSPLQPHSPKSLPASPEFEGLVRQDAHFCLPAAVEIFERAHAPKGNRHPRLPPHQCSPIRPLSGSSGSSREAVERQLTQGDDAESRSERQADDAELRWPTDDELGVVPAEGMSDRAVSKQNSRRGTPSDSARGRNFRYGSLNVPLGASPPQESHTQSQFVLQTQAPYRSQTP